MKIALIFFAGLLITSSPQWLTNFEQAKTEASQKHRYILLNFSGSDWCIPCIRLKKNVFESNEFKSFADSALVLLNADFPRNNKISKLQLAHNELLAEQYNPAGKFPFTLLLDAEGNVLEKWDELTGTTVTAFILQVKNIVQKSR